jgi:hypothetical protein
MGFLAAILAISAFVIACAAIVMVFKGRIGQAIVTFIVALVTAGLAVAFNSV